MILALYIFIYLFVGVCFAIIFKNDFKHIAKLRFYLGCIGWFIVMIYCTLLTIFISKKKPH